MSILVEENGVIERNISRASRAFFEREFTFKLTKTKTKTKDKNKRSKTSQTEFGQ